MAEILFLLFLFLAVVTVFGHGLWLLFAWLYRLLSGSKRSEPASQAGKTEDENGVVRRVLFRLVAQGLLPPDQADQVRAALRGERVAPEKPDSEPDTESAPVPAPAPKPPPLPPEMRKPEEIVAAPSPPTPPPLPTPVPAESAPPPPSLGERLKGFLQSSNMRWGELVGGLLVVVSAISLVLSFWSTINEAPLLKVLVVAGINVALFVAALYSHRRWQLPRASQALAIITLLLSPVTMLATRGLENWPVWGAASVVLGLVALLAWIDIQSACILRLHRRIWLAAGLLLPALGLLVQSQLPPPAWLGFWFLPALLVALTGTVATVQRAEESVWQRLGMNALLWFGAALPLLFVAARLFPVLAEPATLAPVVGLIGLPLLWAGCRERVAAEGVAALTASYLLLAGTAILACSLVLTLLEPGMLTLTSALALALMLPAVLRFRQGLLWPAIHFLTFTGWLGMVALLHIDGSRLNRPGAWLEPAWLAWCTPLALLWTASLFLKNDRNSTPTFYQTITAWAVGSLTLATIGVGFPVLIEGNFSLLLTLGFAILLIANSVTALKLGVRLSVELALPLLVIILRAAGLEWSAAAMLGGLALLAISFSYPHAAKTIQALRCWRQRSLIPVLATPLVLFAEAPGPETWTWLLLLGAIDGVIRGWLLHSPRSWLGAQAFLAGALAAGTTIPSGLDSLGKAATLGMSWALLAATLLLLPRWLRGRPKRLHQQAGEGMALLLAHLSALFWIARLVFSLPVTPVDQVALLTSGQACWFGGWWLALAIGFFLPSQTRWRLVSSSVFFSFLPLFLAFSLVPAASFLSGLAWFCVLVSALSLLRAPTEQGLLFAHRPTRALVAAILWSGMATCQLARLMHLGPDTAWPTLPLWLDMAGPFALMTLIWSVNSARARDYTGIAFASIGWIGVLLALFFHSGLPLWTGAQGYGLAAVLILIAYAGAWYLSGHSEWAIRFNRAALGVGALFWLVLNVAVFLMPETIWLAEAWKWLALLPALAVGWFQVAARGVQGHRGWAGFLMISALAHPVATILGDATITLPILAIAAGTAMFVHTRKSLNERDGLLILLTVAVPLLAQRLVLHSDSLWVSAVISLVLMTLAWIEAGRTLHPKLALGIASLAWQLAIGFFWAFGWLNPETRYLFLDHGWMDWIPVAIAGQCLLNAGYQWRHRHRSQEALVGAWAGTITAATLLALAEWIALLNGMQLPGEGLFRLASVIVVNIVYNHYVWWGRDETKRDGDPAGAGAGAGAGFSDSGISIEWSEIRRCFGHRGFCLELAFLLVPSLSFLLAPSPWNLLVGSGVAALLALMPRWRTIGMQALAMFTSGSALLALFLVHSAELVQSAIPAPWIREVAVLAFLLTALRWRPGIAMALAAAVIGWWEPGELAFMTGLGLVLAAFAAMAPAGRRSWQMTVFTLSAAWLVAQLIFFILGVRSDEPWMASLAVAVGFVGFGVRLVLDAAQASSETEPAAKWAGLQVYGAELMLLFAVVHLRLAVPAWFGVWLETLWPFLVYLFAMAGIGTAEWLAKRGNTIFPEPLRRTGYLLPLLPLLGVWAESDGFHPAGALFAGSALYLFLALTRRSVWLTAAAALFLNAGYWSLLLEIPANEIWRQPQAWLVPLAISALATIELHKKALPGGWLVPLRAIALALLYLSSTADLVLKGIGESAALSMLLALFSVLGIVAGLLLRVRAFLFTGLAFLLVALASLVWSAIVQVGWHWIWAACGLVLGLLIIGALAWLEKNRARVDGWLAALKSWEG